MAETHFWAAGLQRYYEILHHNQMILLNYSEEPLLTALGCSPLPKKGLHG